MAKNAGHELLKAQLRKRIPLTQAEFDRALKYFIPKKIRKKEFLLHESDVCRCISFVTKGCLRAYSIDGKGEEHIIQFAMEDWWISDLHSFLSGLPATYNIEAIEDSELLVLEKDARERLLTDLPVFERYFRLLQEANYIATHRRISESLSASAEERYLAFMRTYPALFERVAQHDVASYLGITPQSLSRIRKELSTR